VLEQLKGCSITKKQGFFSSNGIYDLSLKGFTNISFGSLIEFTIRGTTLFLDQTPKPGFNEIGL